MTGQWGSWVGIIAEGGQREAPASEIALEVGVCGIRTPRWCCHNLSGDAIIPL